MSVQRFSLTHTRLLLTIKQKSECPPWFEEKHEESDCRAAATERETVSVNGNVLEEVFNSSQERRGEERREREGVSPEEDWHSFYTEDRLVKRERERERQRKTKLQRRYNLSRLLGFHYGQVLHKEPELNSIEATKTIIIFTFRGLYSISKYRSD
ncbi:Hypothetical predicted protein [Xyrichtys novacula]|uniref:Uncharacterized protein n=1 Tax=Xyrichtys novacula TaxID=13765 RepID=A0AAV1GWQ8_XYRNO|nr:Hypothetical predicted protein [Xyrichtys novacula]